MIALFKSWSRLLLASLVMMLLFASAGAEAQTASGTKKGAVVGYRDPPPDPPFNDATFGGQSVPATMVTGGIYNVSVVMTNSGTKTWAAGTAHALGAQNPQDSATWGRGRIALPASVAPGKSATFNFQVTAPAIAGSYNFQWMMVQDWVEWFGAQTPNVAVTVNAPAPPPPPPPPPAPRNDAQVVSASVPATMTQGQSYSIAVTMKNTGNTTWPSGASYRLGSTNPNNTILWGVNRVNLNSAVAPGQQYSFAFSAVAPAAGSYTMGWGMLQENVAWFGGTSSSAVTVNAPGKAPTISASRTPSPMTAGQPYTLTWSSSNATSVSRVCTASATGYTVNDTPALSGSATGTANASWVNNPSTCTWKATGAGGTATFNETMVTNAAPTGEVVTYIHTDGLGSPVARTDAAGNVISRTRYEPYGLTAAGTTPTLGFTGHVNDADTGLVYMQQRYYDPVAGRFLSIDPVTTDANTGGNFNRYAYTNNNPYRYIDPDGRNAYEKFKALGLLVRNGSLAVHPKTGVPFKGGFPDFSSVATHTVSIKQTGGVSDFAAANLAAGLSETPKGSTWHHVEDGTTMQLVPTDIHAKTGHSGGAALAKAVGAVALAAVVGDTGAEVIMGEKPANGHNMGIATQDFILNLLPFSMGVSSAGGGSDKVPGQKEEKRTEEKIE